MNAPSKLSPRNVFIDTSVFHGAKYDYSRLAFKRLVDLVKAGLVNVLTTSITTREVETRIQTVLEEAKRAAKRFRKEVPILAEQRFPEFQAAFSRLDVPELTRRMESRYQTYMGECDATDVEIESGSIREVFDQYFESRKPFAGADKKSEFPDAFVLAALREWCIQREDRCFVVSHDQGMVDACDVAPMLEGVSSLEKFVEIITKEEQSALALAAVEAFDQHVDGEIARALTEGFEHLGFWIDQPEGEVIEVLVNRVDTEDASLVAIGQPPTATFELTVTFHFDAAVQYADPESGIWDSEDKRMLFRETIEASVECEEAVEAEVSITFDPDDSEAFRVDRVTVNRGVSIEVGLWDEYEHYY